MAKCPILSAGARQPVGRFIGVGALYPGVDRVEQEYELYDGMTECLGQACQLWSTWYVTRHIQSGDDIELTEIEVSGCGLLSGQAIPHNGG